MAMKVLVVVLACVLLGSCGSGAIATPPPAVNEDTSLGPGDVFDIRVYGEPDLSSNYSIGRDGTIDFPYIGSTEVAGLEPSAVAELIEGRLREREVLVNPQVSVLVTEYNSKRITVSGAVRNPGNYAMTPGLTALEAVSLAGGTTDLANRDGTTLMRRTNGVPRRYAVPLDRITAGVSEDFRVRDGDIINVPERIF